MISAAEDDFERLRLQNTQKYQQTLLNYQQTYEYEQELRQVSLYEEEISIQVHVAREDFPTVSSLILLKYLYSAAQGYWIHFLNQIKEKLHIDFIDSIYEKETLRPIHTTLNLQNHGSYLVRQREESSILELIHTGQRPNKIVYPILNDINLSKQKLQELVSNEPSMNQRVDRLITQPCIKKRQRGIITLLLKASLPEEILQIINELVKIKSIETLPKNIQTEELIEAINLDNIKKQDPELDLITIYRISLECLNRHAIRGLMEEVGDDAIVSYILDILKNHQLDIDIVVIGMKLLNDIVKVLTRHIEQVFHVVMNTLQHYAPSPTKAYPRVIKRLLPSPEEIAKKRQEDEEKRLKEQKLKEEQDLIELESKICAKEQEVSKAALQNITTKVTIPKVNQVILTKKQLKIQKQMKERKNKADQYQSSLASESMTSQTSGSHQQGDQQMSELLNTTSKTNKLNDEGVKRSGRLPVAQVVNIPRNHPSASQPQLHQHHHQGETSTPTLPPVSTWKGPKISRRPLKSLAEPVPKKKNLWSSLLSTGALSFDLGGEGTNNLDLLEENSSLPQVSGIKFTGITGNQKNQVAFLQCIMTIYQYISCHYANRECAYDLFIHEELADIGLLCVHLPRVMSYILWSLDKIMTDRIEEAENRVQTQLARKKNLATAHDESESNLSVGSDYEKKNNLNELSKQIAVLTRPVDNILLFFAICCHMSELDDNDRQMASKWMNKWDDKTTTYQAIRNRGREIANL